MAAFSKFYTKTVLSNSVTPRAIYDIEAKIDGYFFLDPTDVESFNKVLYESAHTAKDKKQMTFYLQKAKRVIDGFADDKRGQIALDIRHFIRFYEFLLQASCFEDVELHKKYNFLSYLIAYIGIPQEVLLDWMLRIDPSYSSQGKDYYRIVVEYLERIKIE